MMLFRKNNKMAAIAALTSSLAALTGAGCGDDGLARVDRGELALEAGGGQEGGFFVAFEPVAPGFRKDALQDIIIKNGGLGTLTISSIEIVTDKEGYISPKTTVPQTPFSLTSEETLPIKFRLAIPAPSERPEPLTCPDLPGGVPAALQENYCGHVLIKSGPPDNQTRIIYFQVNKATGTIEVSPSVLTFDNPQVGRAITKELTLTNSSTSGPLIVDKITKLDFTGGADSQFAIDGFGFPLTLQPGSSETYRIIYTPTTADAITGKLQVESDDPANPKKTVTVQTGSANAAQIDVQPGALIFPAAAPGNPQTQELTITNTGNGAALTLTNFLITGNEARAVYAVEFERNGAFVPWTNGSMDTIARQNSKVYRVTYTPVDDQSITGNLRIFSNATNVANGEVNINLSGSSAAPDGLIAPATIIFDVRPGQSDSRDFAVRNEGLADLEIGGFSFVGTLTPEEFSISPDPAGVTVAPGQVVSFELTYNRRPDDIGLDQGSLVLDTNNPVNDGELTINVRNNNQDNAFSPVARITPTPAGAVTVGTLVSLDGEGSTPESGELTFHLWTLLSRPSGSEADLSDLNGTTTTLTPDAPGRYRVQLVVGNSLSLEGSTVQEITVTE